ncbi:glycosyltransferase [Geomonas anaerohicana]|uniref:Glycosyltransferase n=1 Tax=Geomonas anaerohicana TaxID=2798583 RepID=A0ABS0YGP0_9BACT|nr:glycosyltransferase [Geomonas anaerohicana]MBJ6751456.1 glycosyltransferase [Geomonas anaerohicana]
MSQPLVAACVLFYEKVEQTIHCVTSLLPAGIPVLVLNNGSSAAAVETFAAWAAAHPQVQLLHAERNLGVSAGRNRLIAQTSADWLLFVDNDIVMETPRWLERLQHYAELDVEAIVPRLYNHHDGCYAKFMDIEVQGRQAGFVPLTGNRMNNFPGGAALVRRTLFDRLGCYDEGLFVGVEDFELSLRGVLAGAPVRALLVPDIELTHDHLVPLSTEADRKAVRDRYDKDVLANSYRRIAEKHDLLLEDFWEEWVDQQMVSLGLAPQQDEQPAPARPQGKPRIALVADVENWAFGNISRNVVSHLSGKYDLHIVYSASYGHDYDRLLADLYQQGYDLVHFFWRGTILCLYLHLLRTIPKRTPEVPESFIRTRLSFSIYDHCLLSDQDLRDYRILFKYLADGYVVSSQRLFHTYSMLPSYPAPYRIIEDGVDLARFHPRDTSRLLDLDRPLVVGWAGNSDWGMDVNATDFKGFNTIIKPALDQLRQEGYRVTGRFADRKVEHIPYDKMVDYYNSIDVYVCASSIEGTPNPVLEAMACGVPVISTDVGIVPQLLGPEQKRYILMQRTVEALKEKLIALAQDPQERMKLSAENLERIKGFTREMEIPKWDDFFQAMLSRETASKEPLKRALLEVPYNFGIEHTVDLFLEKSLSWRITKPLRLLQWHVTRFKNMLRLQLRRRRAG